ncbi:hypothetical protein Rmf_44030 [Roseomonas fluvialis]|uniref:Uncharacterized protein n=1 Tax=Roseomonas fluvialis TaxID=1750527 RepID=A0ABM7Y8W3_9PROT|nr:hypothetical protein Rmf_44030 [Roseomonas fluvialis]
MHPFLVAGQLDLVALEAIDDTDVFAVAGNDGHVFADLVAHVIHVPFPFLGAEAFGPQRAPILTQYMKPSPLP